MGEVYGDIDRSSVPVSRLRGIACPSPLRPRNGTCRQRNSREAVSIVGMLDVKAKYGPQISLRLSARPKKDFGQQQGPSNQTWEVQRVS